MAEPVSPRRRGAVARRVNAPGITANSWGHAMMNRRRFTGLIGATTVNILAAPALVPPASAQTPAPSLPRGNYLIRNGAVITVDAAGVLPRADVHVSNGRIEAVGPNLNVPGAEIIDATDMIVMPGFIDTHYHMWSALGRNF